MISKIFISFLVVSVTALSSIVSEYAIDWDFVDVAITVVTGMIGYIIWEVRRTRRDTKADIREFKTDIISDISDIENDHKSLEERVRLNEQKDELQGYIIDEHKKQIKVLNDELGI